MRRRNEVGVDSSHDTADASNDNASGRLANARSTV